MPGIGRGQDGAAAQAVNGREREDSLAGEVRQTCKRYAAALHQAMEG